MTTDFLILLFFAGLINIGIMYAVISSATKAKLSTQWLQQIARNQEIQTYILIELYRSEGGTQENINQIIKSSENLSYLPKFKHDSMELVSNEEIRE